MKSLHWISRSKKDLCSFPKQVVREIGYALHFAQAGDRHPSVKPLRGFGGAGVLEIVENYAGDTCRAVYTVKFSEMVYVLHAFQKKSKKGIKTPQRELDLIRERLKLAQAEYEEYQKEKK